MGLFDRIRETVSPSPKIDAKPVYLSSAYNRVSKAELVEQVSPKTPAPKNVFQRGNKVPHAYDLRLFENAYNDVPLVASMVDTLTNLSVGPGVYVGSKDDELNEFLNDWMHEVDFELFLAPMFRNSLVFGFSSAEILWNGTTIEGFQLQDPKTMLKLREIGKLKYSGYVFDDSQQQVEFPMNSLWWNDFNVLGTNAYGTSLIRSMIGNGKNASALTNKLMIEENMAILMKRKANAPVDITLGTPEKPPLQSDVDAVTAGFEVMGPLTEWVHGPNMVINGALDIGGKIINPAPFLDHFERQIKMAGKVPDVYLGYGNIAEGLAKEQGEVMSMLIRSYRNQIERGIEQQLLKPLAVLNGFTEFPELNWGVPTPEQEKDKLEMLVKLLSPSATVSPYTKIEIEKQVRNILGFESDLPDDAIDFLKPPVPSAPPNSEGEFEESANSYEFIALEKSVAEKYEVLPLVLKALASASLELEGLSAKQNELVRDILLRGVASRKGAEFLARVLAKKVYAGDLDKARTVARTELAKAENEAALKAYSQSDAVSEAEWLTHEDERTCPICGPRNGERYSLVQARGMLPAHPNCRCAFLPVVTN